MATTMRPVSHRAASLRRHFSHLRVLVVPFLLLIALRLRCHGFVLVPTLSTTGSNKESLSKHHGPQNRRNLKRRWKAAASTDEVDATTTTISSSCLPDSYVKSTVTFPVSFAELMQLETGSFVVSDTILVPTSNDTTADFCVKLYPRGGGHGARKTIFGDINDNQGFGMSYALGNNNDNDKVGVYLQYLPPTNDKAESLSFVDASFALRLVGNQQSGPRFDVEWRAGMRFTPDETKLAQGLANDFGAHLMQTSLLASFCGITEENYLQQQQDSNAVLQMQVEIQLHQDLQTHLTTENDGVEENAISRGLGFWKLHDIRYPTSNDDDGKNRSNEVWAHDTDEVRVGKVVVPVLRRLSQRNDMFAKGVYPGVEYRILRILDETEQEDIFYSRPNAHYELKPIYPLVPQLERQWPVRIDESDIPKLYTPNMYNIVSAIGSLLTAITGLALAFVISQAISFFYIPSRSMDPTLQVGDVLLVEKVSPRLLGTYRKGDVVLFSPPEPLRQIVAQSGGKPLTSRDLFVKRIAAEPGDTVRVDPGGKVQINGEFPLERRDLCTAEPLGLIRRYLPKNKDEIVIEPGTVEVLGDCSSVSIDSRVWGPLPQANIVGRPLVRLWPLSKFGALPPLEQTLSEPLTKEWTSD